MIRRLNDIRSAIEFSTIILAICLWGWKGGLLAFTVLFIRGMVWVAGDNKEKKENLLW